MVILSIKNEPLSVLRGGLSSEERRVRLESKERILDNLMFASARRAVVENEKVYATLLEEIVARFELSFLAPVLWLGNNPRHVLDFVRQDDSVATPEERKHILNLFIQAMRNEIQAERNHTISPSWAKLVSNDNQKK